MVHDLKIYIEINQGSVLRINKYGECQKYKSLKIKLDKTV